jgi:glutaredoxin 3
MEVNYLAVELDKFHEEGEILNALTELTSQRTVPNVFVGGQHVGGCDDTVDLHRTGELAKMLEAAGVEFKKE